MKKNIFIVEDDTDIRELLTLLLSKEKYAIKGFANLKSFKEKIASDIPDLVVLDVMLPDGNGIDMCRVLKADDPTRNVPVLLMSANIHNKEKAAECSAEDFISKPFDIHDFTGRVDKLISMKSN